MRCGWSLYIDAKHHSWTIMEAWSIAFTLLIRWISRPSPGFGCVRVGEKGQGPTFAIPSAATLSCSSISWAQRLCFSIPTTSTMKMGLNTVRTKSSNEALHEKNMPLIRRLCRKKHSTRPVSKMLNVQFLKRAFNPWAPKIRDDELIPDHATAEVVPITWEWKRQMNMCQPAEREMSSGVLILFKRESIPMHVVSAATRSLSAVTPLYEGPKDFGFT